MTPRARLTAAMEVLDDLRARRRPAAEALKDWGLSHRFAGSKDRAAIATLVYDALRRRASAAWIMGDRGAGADGGGEAAGRALVLGMLALQRGLGVEADEADQNAPGQAEAKDHLEKALAAVAEKKGKGEKVEAHRRVT